MSADIVAVGGGGFLMVDVLPTRLLDDKTTIDP